MFVSTGMRQIAAGFLFAAVTTFAASNPPIPPAAADVSLATQPGKETAVFAGGCFWGVQAVFQRVKGVISTAAGYSGGIGADGHVQTGRDRDHRARRVGAGNLRSLENHLWPTAANLLFRGA